jgi:DNA primase
MLGARYTRHMAYRREDIEQVRAATDLVELVAEVTKVKKSGRSVMAVCPFHEEKDPSLSVDRARGLYHCFGCGQSGDVFRFVQETQAVDFNDAVEMLARRAGIPLHREPGAARRRDRREALIGVVEKTVGFYHERLRRAPDAAGARKYLRTRGYDADTVGRYRLGFSPNAGDVLVRHLREEKVAEDVMIAAGVAARGRSGRLFDRFRGRVMFPIFDLRGDAVGFGARLLQGEGPKYLNSPETAVYQKSRLLYGLNWAKAPIVRRNAAVVVEGYTDVIALARQGIETAVATCGTALGESHLDLLRRFTERVVLMFDADQAGVDASLRGFERSMPGDLDLRVALLPAGRDPADVAAAGDVGVLKEAIEGSEPLLQFRIEQELRHYDYLGEREAAARALNAVAALVALHPDEVVRREYEEDLANRLIASDVQMVHAAVERARRGRSRPQESPTEPVEALSGLEKAERELLRLMLANHPGLRGVAVNESFFSRPEHLEAYRLLAPVLESLDPGEPPDLGSLFGEEEEPVAALLSSLALADRPLPADAAALVDRIRVGVLNKRIEEVRRKADECERAGESEKASAHLEELIALQQEREALRSSR